VIDNECKELSKTLPVMPELLTQEKERIKEIAFTSFLESTMIGETEAAKLEGHEKILIALE
jgi:hypothetical protein